MAKKNKEVCKKIGFARYWSVIVYGHGGGLALLLKKMKVELKLRIVVSITLILK